MLRAHKASEPAATLHQQPAVWSVAVLDQLDHLVELQRDLEQGAGRRAEVLKGAEAAWHDDVSCGWWQSNKMMSV